MTYIMYCYFILPMPKILRVKSKDEANVKFKNIKAPLLKPSFMGVVNGSVRSGKSNVLMNFIYNNEFYKDVFDKIIFISPTVDNDITLKHLNEDEDIIKISDNLDSLDDILKTIVDTKEEDEDEKKKYYLIVLDDMLGYIKPKGYTSYLGSRYRQFKLSLIFTCQSFRSIPNIIRTNATFYLIFRTTNKKEEGKYEEEFSSIFDNWKELYDAGTKEPYSFLYLDLRNCCAYKNFDERLS